MTLCTDFYVLDPIDISELWAEVTRLLMNDMRLVQPEHVLRTHEGESSEYGSKGELKHSTSCGQGLPAWTFLHYREDGKALVTAEQAAAHNEDCDDARAYSENQSCASAHKLAHWVSVDWDTVYGYSDDLGRNCGVLHAGYIVALATWCRARGVRTAWKNEYTGEIYPGTEAISTLIGESDAATKWFAEIVLPRVNSEIGKTI